MHSDINWILIFKTFSCYINVTDRIFSLFILNSHLSIFMFDLILILLKSNVNTFRGFSKRRLSFQHLLWCSDLCYLFKHRLSFIVGFKYLELLTNSFLCSCKWLKKRWLNLKRCKWNLHWPSSITSWWLSFFLFTPSSSISVEAISQFHLPFEPILRFKLNWFVG